MKRNYQVRIRNYFETCIVFNIMLNSSLLPILTGYMFYKMITILAKKGHTEAVIIGGAMTMSEFINAGLVDDIYFMMEPVLFGSGLPLLKNVQLESKLNLLEVKKLNDNTVQLHYEIKKQP